VLHETSNSEAARFGIEPPYFAAQFDFRLKQASGQDTSALDAQRRLAALGARAAG
jgi:hypothetical protein